VVLIQDLFFTPFQLVFVTGSLSNFPFFVRCSAKDSPDLTVYAMEKMGVLLLKRRIRLWSAVLMSGNEEIM